jgi:hypothetical protein
MNEVDEHMEHAGRQLQTMLSAALAIAQAVAERRDRAVREAARQAGADEQEVARRAQVDRLTQAESLPTAAEVAGRGPLSENPARSLADVADGLRSADPAEVARAWAALEAVGGADPGEWDALLRAAGTDPDRARAEAVKIKADLVDPAMDARDAARRVEDLAAAQVVIGGDVAADRGATRDQAVVLEKLHGADWVGQAAEATRDGAIAGAKAVSNVPSGAAEQAQAPTPAEGVGAWQNGAEAPRLAGMAQTARAGHSSLPGRSGSQLRRNAGMPGRAPARGPALER